MEGVRRGGDRQVLHERVRIHSQAASSGDDLLQRIASDPLFGIDRKTMDAMANPNNYIGLSRQQTERFLIEEIDPILSASVIRRTATSSRVRRRCGYEAFGHMTLLAVIIVAVHGCATAPKAQTVPPPTELRGVASWYGQEYAGRSTANGEIFDPLPLHGGASHASVRNRSRCPESENASERARSHQRSRAVHRRPDDRPVVRRRAADRTDRAGKRRRRADGHQARQGRSRAAGAVRRHGSRCEGNAGCRVRASARCVPAPSPRAQRGSSRTFRWSKNIAAWKRDVRCPPTGARSKTFRSPVVRPSQHRPSQRRPSQRRREGPSRSLAAAGTSWCRSGRSPRSQTPNNSLGSSTRSDSRPNIDNGTSLFYVRLGPFDTRDQAIQARTRLESAGMSAIVVAQ